MKVELSVHKNRKPKTGYWWSVWFDGTYSSDVGEAPNEMEAWKAALDAAPAVIAEADFLTTPKGA